MILYIIFGIITFITGCILAMSEPGKNDFFRLLLGSCLIIISAGSIICAVT